MATIQERTNKDGSTSYRAMVRLLGITESKTFPRKTDAKNWAQDKESDIRNRRYFNHSEAEKHTLGEMIDRYTVEVLPTLKSARSRKHQLEWWKEQLGKRLIADVTPALIAEYRDKLTREGGRYGKLLSPATVVRYLAALSAAYTVAVKEWGWVDASPMSKVSKPKEPRGRVRFLSEDEKAALLKACKESSNTYLYPVVVLALATGMRQGEIMGLQWRDIDLERGVIILHETKNNERRRIPVAGFALELLRKHHDTRTIETYLVFPGKRTQRYSAKGEGHYKPMDLRAPWLAALEKAEIEDFLFHDLRHTAASYLAMNGASLAEIAEILGHKTLAMVKRYAHLSDSHITSVVASMNERMFG